MRPEFQHPAGTTAATQGTLIDEEPEPTPTPVKPARKHPWPKSLPEQAQAVRAALSTAPGGLTPEQLARQFQRARADKVAELLETLVSLGQARPLPNGRYVRS